MADDGSGGGGGFRLGGVIRRRALLQLLGHRDKLHHDDLRHNGQLPDSADGPALEDWSYRRRVALLSRVRADPRWTHDSRKRSHIVTYEAYRQDVASFRGTPKWQELPFADGARDKGGGLVRLLPPAERSGRIAGL